MYMYVTDGFGWMSPHCRLNPGAASLRSTAVNDQSTDEQRNKLDMKCITKKTNVDFTELCECRNNQVYFQYHYRGTSLICTHWCPAYVSELMSFLDKRIIQLARTFIILNIYQEFRR